MIREPFEGLTVITDHYLSVAKFWELLLVNKEQHKNCLRKNIYFWRINDAEVKEKYQAKISNRFAAM
jgi:hypothetical protein